MEARSIAMRNTRCFTLISTLAGGDSGAESSLEEELYFSQSGSEELAPADLKGGALGLREDAGAEGATSVAGWVAPSPWGGGGGEVLMVLHTLQIYAV
jgi:hypothetical protein